MKFLLKEFLLKWLYVFKWVLATSQVVDGLGYCHAWLCVVLMTSDLCWLFNG